MKPTAPDNESGGDDGEDLSDWQKSRLKFAPETGKVSFSRSKLIICHCIRINYAPSLELHSSRVLTMYKEYWVLFSKKKNEFAVSYFLVFCGLHFPVNHSADDSH